MTGPLLNRRRMVAGLALLPAACSGDGTTGIAIPPRLDMLGLNRAQTPHDALAAPPEWTPPPEIFTRQYPVPPDRLYATFREMAAAQPRTWMLASYEQALQLVFVVRSSVLNLPDLVTVQILPDSKLVMWSRSVYDHYDFDANLKRLEAWQSALNARLPAAGTLLTN